MQELATQLNAALLPALALTPFLLGRGSGVLFDSLSPVDFSHKVHLSFISCYGMILSLRSGRSAAW